MFLTLSCCCGNVVQHVFCDYYSGNTNIQSTFEPAESAIAGTFESGSGPGVSVMLPATAADLDDCGLYCIGCFGRDEYAFPETPDDGAKWSLSSSEEDLLADWIDAGGKLLMCVDYNELGSNVLISDEYYDAAEAFLAKLGLSVTFGREDSAGGVSAPWPTDTFLSTALTSGITESFEYDGEAGSSFSFTPSGAGTKIYDGTAQTIAYFPAGSGWVLLFGSQNVLWGNKDKSQPTPTGYVAIEKLLDNYHGL